MTAKEGLLLWCRKKTAGYRDVDPPGVQNFTTSFKNGLAFCALIHRHQPQLIDYDSLNKDNAQQNLELAFSVAEKAMNIPRLLDVEDLLVDKPDERSVMTYVSEYFHALAALEVKEASARRTAKFVQFIRSTNAMKTQYESQAQELLTWVGAIIQGWETESFGDSLEDAQAVVDRLKRFVLDEEPPRAAAKLELETLYAEIQTQLKVNGRPTYEVPSDVSPDAIEEAFHQLYLARQAHARKARDHRFTFIKREEAHISDDQVAEFKDSFKHFAHEGALGKEEFKAATSSIGVHLKDAELASTFAQLSESKTEGVTGVTEAAYISYLVNLSEDKDHPEQIKASFKQLANDRPFVRKEDLLIPPLSQEDVDLLAQLMPKNEQGELDYNAFIDSSYSQS